MFEHKCWLFATRLWLFALGWALDHKILDIDFLKAWWRSFFLSKCAIRISRCKSGFLISITNIIISVINFVALLIDFLFDYAFILRVIFPNNRSTIFFVDRFFFTFLWLMKACIWFWTTLFRSQVSDPFSILLVDFIVNVLRCIFVDIGQHFIAVHIHIILFIRFDWSLPRP